MHLFATDQMDIPGVPMPATDSTPSVTYGVVSGTDVGYIYCWRWWTGTVATEFYDAVNALVSDTTLKGMVIDFRYNEGGGIMPSNSGLQLLFRDSVATICFSQRSDPANHFSMRVVDSAFYYVIPGNGTGYDKPIAVLVGPGAVSAGDQVAFRMTFHPRVKTFGKPTNTAFSALTGLSVHSGWYASYAPFEACLASDTTYFLTHRGFPVDVPVWHTRDAVANGKDAVVEAAIAWIDSTAGAVEETPKREVRMTKAPTVIRGVLILPGDRRPGTGDRAALLDIAGRSVLDLKPGANNVRALAPGVYFVREAGARAQAQVVRKVVLTK
jgi:C-terminal processing protease CtpA/Prc